MKRKLLLGSLVLLSVFSTDSLAGEFPLRGGKSKRKSKPNLLREIPYQMEDSTKADSVYSPQEFKPSIQVGSIVHMMASYSQVGYPGSSPSTNGKPEDWVRGAMLYRARIMVGGQLSRKGSFFLETELPKPVGSTPGGKNEQSGLIMLDCQYEHKFSEAFQVISGAQLVSGNRNGLQGAASLMANDFTFYQYAYNTFAFNPVGQPLRSNFGRDVGVNTRGLLLKGKLEYRLGVFLGRGLNGNDPLRTVGRLVYNFLDADKNFYYSGTNLGKGKTISLGLGVDGQANYINVGPDLFIDLPVGPGSITLNTAFQYVSGGTDTVSKFSYTRLIPNSTIQFGELGYYINSLKIQPWIRYENFTSAAVTEQTSGVPTALFDKTHSSTVFGGGLNYFFNGYGTNLRLSYVTKTATTPSATVPFETETKAYGQAWLQLQFFFF
ncbi:MAG: hypothetical protein H7329_15045 [Opitutaceae bacterium]|nr:hypothetical protein [Cytophagales bacterium]